MGDSSKRGAHFGSPKGSPGAGASADRTTVMPSREHAFTPAPLFADGEADCKTSAGATPMDRTQVMPHAAAPRRAAQPGAVRPGAMARGTAPARDYDGVCDADAPSNGGRGVAVAMVVVVALVMVAFAVMFFAQLGPFATPADKETAELTEGKSMDSKSAAEVEDADTSQVPTVEGGAVDDSGDGQTVAPAGGTGADNEVDAGTLFGGGASGDNGDSNQGGNQGGSSTDGRDPADNDVPAPDNGSGDQGDSGDQGGNGQNGPVTEPDGSQWTGYY